MAADRLAGLLGQYKQTLRLIILDTCDSLPQARKIVKTVDAAIGVAGAITEPVAIDFFAMFYNALANGSSIQRAYGQARGPEVAKIEGDRRYRREVEEIVEESFDARRHLPQLVHRSGVELDRVFLAG